MSNMNYFKIAMVSAALAVSGAAMAESPSWTSLQVQYGWGDSCSDCDNYAGGVAGSAQLFNFVHLGGTFTTGTNDGLTFNGSDVDVWQINLGGHQSVSDSTDVFADLIMGNVDVDDASDGDFVGASFGVRSNAISDNFEILVGIDVAKVDDEAFGCRGGGCEDSVETSAFVGGRYSFSDAVSFGVTYVDDNFRYDLADSFTVDLRWTFGAGGVSWLGNN
jgi:hypothetical protein